MSHYALGIPKDTVRPIRRWLVLGITALAVAGLFALLLGLARTPALASIGPLKDVFHVALVVHVDLSVLVWFLAIISMLWRITYPTSSLPYVSSCGFFCFAAGAALIAISPFAGSGEPLMSNYVPVLTNLPFFVGLALLATGTLLNTLPVLFAPGALDRSAPHTGSFTLALIVLAALVAFGLSYTGLSPNLKGEAFYELVFWGGGHILQFAFAQAMMMAWLWLAEKIGLKLPFSPRYVVMLYLANTLAAFGGLLPYWLSGVQTAAHSNFFTQLMIWAGGIAPTLLAIPLLLALLLHGKPQAGNKIFWSALVSSLALFSYGGILGFMIEGVNVTIPAHYHGAIVGITLSFMGLAYALLPEFGWRSVSESRVAFWQPIIYGIGQTLHITGLALSGGYGALRKTPGTEGLSDGAKAMMGLMGLGNLLAVIGGLLFVFMVLKSIWTGRKPW